MERQNNYNDVNTYAFILKIKKLPFVEKVILFGSRARGTHQSRSDIDLAIVCPFATKDQWLEVMDIIDEADTLLFIDCVNFDTIDTGLKEEIIRDGIEL